MSEQEDHKAAVKTARVRILGSGQGRVSGTYTPPHGTLTVPQGAKFTLADWEAESFSLFAEGGDPAPCPDCGRTGFYGPRFVDPHRRFRGCRFCGFHQEVGHTPENFLPTAHNCASWPEVSRARYIWWVAPDQDSYVCPFCGDEVAVPLSMVPVPREEPDHPWWKVPQGRSQSFYQRLWRNWECCAGRTVL